jgi:hypothetical protein
MDSSKKSDSNQRQREEALARRMGEALDRQVTRNTRDCPDAEVMAAYHEASLDSNEMSRCEEHFAGCARCRKILTVLAASDDTPLAATEVANLGKLVAATQLPRPEDSQRTASPIPIKSAWKTRWLAPALGIAAVLAMWFAVKPPWPSPQETSTTTMIAQAPRSEPPQNAPNFSMPEFSKAAPRGKSDLDSGSLKDKASPRNEVSDFGTDRLSKSRSAKDNAAAPAAPVPSAGLDAIQSEVHQSEGQLQSEPGASGAVKPASPAPAPSLQAEARRDATPMQAPRAAAQSGGLNGNEPAKESADAAESKASKTLKRELTPYEPPLNGRAYTALAPLATSGQSNILLRAPQGLIVWRVGRAGIIERSADGGGTWTAQKSPAQQDWVAGAAVSNKICWIVGRNGAIARTTDGEHWEKIQSPAAAGDTSGKLPDWTGVTASDAQTAVITATDQRRFSTRDGGKTWQSQ